jgi:hypothetical protein
VRTQPAVVARAPAVMKAAGKHPILARDGIGFVVNRCARPFYGEALKLVAEGRDQCAGQFPPAAGSACVAGWSTCCLSWLRDPTPSLRNALLR